MRHRLVLGQLPSMISFTRCTGLETARLTLQARVQVFLLRTVDYLVNAIFKV